MKFVISPDSLKGSLSAVDAANAIADGIRSVYPKPNIVMIPLADGGEGTVEALVAATQGRFMQHTVSGPLGDPMNATFGFSGLEPHTAFVEMAAASGITLIPQDRRNPLLTSTFGTGELLMAAVNEGAKKIVIGIGGSATNDGGAGAMQALGVRFLDKQGQLLPEPIGGADLIRISEIDLSQIKFPISEIPIIVASDVTNPLIGPNGASAIYGPQKGATPEMIKQLDEALANYAHVIELTLHVSISDRPGAGAAGGLGGGLIAFLQAQMASGIDIILDAANFEHAVTDADWVITGEGRIDSQTLQGKTISGVMKRTLQNSSAKVIAYGGAVDENARRPLLNQGLHAAFAITPSGMPIEEAMRNAAALLTKCVAETISGIVG